MVNFLLRVSFENIESENNNEKSDGKKGRRGTTAGTATAIGVGVGVALFSATDAPAWIAVGVGVGLAVGVVMDARSK